MCRAAAKASRSSPRPVWRYCAKTSDRGQLRPADAFVSRRRHRVEIRFVAPRKVEIGSRGPWPPATHVVYR